LFQAESRRCKEIIDIIYNSESKTSRHYGIFDELYSGTNPDEATKTGYAFLKYLTKYQNVDFILTTHYNKICSKLKKNEHIQNYKMNVIQEQDKHIYTYKIKKGISKVQGALQILEEMDYPKEIIQEVKQFHKKEVKKVQDTKPKDLVYDQ
jgi:DNA mismatch repair ATPase MutS